jgi:hypothetical protein
LAPRNAAAIRIQRNVIQLQWDIWKEPDVSSCVQTPRAN